MLSASLNKTLSSVLPSSQCSTNDVISVFDYLKTSSTYNYVTTIIPEFNAHVATEGTEVSTKLTDDVRSQSDRISDSHKTNQSLDNSDNMQHHKPSHFLSSPSHSPSSHCRHDDRVLSLPVQRNVQVPPLLISVDLVWWLSTRQFREPGCAGRSDVEHGAGP